MSKIRLIGAVGIKVKPDVSEFKDEVRDALRRVPDEMTIDVKVDVDDKAAKKRLESLDGDKYVNVKVSTDYDSIQSAKKRIHSALRNLETQEIPVKLDEEGLRAAHAKLKRLAGSAKISMEITDDEAGYRSVLAKIQRIKAEKASVLVDFKTNNKELDKIATEYKRKLEAIKPKATLTIEHTNDRESLTAAVRQVDDALKNLKRVKITPELDKDALLAARADLERKLADKPVRLRFARDKEGWESALKEIQKFQREDMAKQFYFRTDTAGLAEAERKVREQLAKIEANRTIKIGYAGNFDGISGAIDEIDKRLQELKKLELETKLDEASLLKAKAKLEAQLGNADVEMKFSQDEAGYKKVLAKVREIQAKATEIPISFKTDPATLDQIASDMEAKLKGLEDITVHVGTDHASLLGAIAQIDGALADLKKIEINTKLNETDLQATKARLKAELANAKTEIKVDFDSTDSLSAARKKLEAMLPPTREVALTVGTDADSINQAIYEIDKAKQEAEKKKIKLETEATGLGLMAARLAVATRPRTVPFYIRINEKSLLVAEGILKSLSGYNVLSNLGQQLESLFTKFDTVALKGGTAATAIGNVVNVLGSVGTSMFSIGDGISQSIGLLAAAPALFTALGAGLFVYTAAFDNFSNAFSEDAKKRAQALEELPPNARAAVESLRGLYDEIAHPVQDAFWDRMGTSLQDAVDHLIPQVKDGLKGMASGAGAFTAGILDSFTEISQNGQLEEMFKNITGFFEQTGQAAKPFFDGFNQFGIRGSEYLPQFGGWLKDMAIQFDAWATKSSENGDINRWIEEGVQSLKDMWNVGGSVIRIFQGITSAVQNAGGPSLHSFSDTLSGIADKINSPAFKGRLTDIFLGAREGASLLKDGALDLAESLGKNSEWLGKMLVQLGGLGGKFLTNVSVTMDSSALRSGLDATAEGLDRMLLQLRPAFEDLGTIIGGIGTIAGGVFSHLGPLISTAVDLVAGLVDQLAGPLSEAAGTLIDTMTGRVEAFRGPVEAVGGLLKGVLDVFNALPDGIDSAIVALGIFLLMRGQLSAMFTAIGNSGPFTRMRDNWVMNERAAGRYSQESQRQFRLTTAFAEGSVRQLGNLRTSWGNYTTAVANSATPVRTALAGVRDRGFGGLKAAASGLMGFMGGPWGLAMAGAGVAVSLIGEHAAEQKQKIEDLASSMDKSSGQITSATKQLVAKEWMQGDTNWWDDMVRGTERAKDGIKDLGLTSEQVTDMISNGGPKYDETIEKLKLIRDNIGVDPQAAAAGYSPVMMSLEELSTKTGYTVEELKKMDRTSLSNVISQMETGRDRVNETQQRVRDLAAAAGLAEGDAGRLAGAVETLGNKASTASERVGAIKTELDILRGGALSQEEATRAFEKSWESALNTLDGVVTKTDANGKKSTISLGKFIDDATGKITDLKGAGGVLFDATKEVTDAQLLMAQSTYQSVFNATGSTEKATQAALDKLKLAPDQVAAFADKIGVETGEAQKLLEGFFAEDWQMTAIFSGNSELFFETKKKAEDEGVKFDQAYWEATLAANGLPSQQVIAETLAKGKDFTKEQYIATLKAMPLPALQKISEAVGAGDAYKRKDYSAIMKAINGTSPGLALALIEIGKVKNGNYAAAIKAFMDQVSAEQTRRDLAAIANTPRSAKIQVLYEDAGLAPKIPASIRRPTSGPGAMNGAILDKVSNFTDLLSGKFPMQMLNVKAFANGGIENHVAQIASPRPGTVRIWGEEETGGEAYIPLSMQKRTRSTQILGEVASRFGYTLQAKAFADGGVVGAGSRERSQSVAVNIDSYIQQSNDTADDVARAIMRRVKSRGVYSPLEGF